MDRKDIVRYLETFVKKQKSEVNYGTYRETYRSSLLKEGLSTRANSVWKQSQFVVAYFYEEGDPDVIAPYLQGWSELTRGSFDQYLLLECPKGEWTVYDKDCHEMSIEELKYVPQYKEQVKENTDYVSPKRPDMKNSKYSNIITAIKTKPFLLLAGISGTGKSRIVRELARACWPTDSDEYKAQKPSNFEMVQVKPNWHDSTELIGYVSRVSGKPEFIPGEFLRFVARAWENIDTPYFLCLDEMNLAPVEQYFAEYLSVIESRKTQTDGSVSTDPILKKPNLITRAVDYVEGDTNKDWYGELVMQLTNNSDVIERFMRDGICIPQNLIVIGTVNMDETTFSFSRKVLDRAMTIEMNEVDLYGGLKEVHEPIGLLSKDDLIGTNVEGKDVYADNEKVCNLVIEYLIDLNNQLENTPFKIAYRTRNEFLLYVVNNLPYNKDSENNDLPENYVIARALDEITSMKILSRIEGDDTKVSEDLLTNLSSVIKDKLEKLAGEEHLFKSLSVAKLDEMSNRLNSGYVSFWS